MTTGSGASSGLTPERHEEVMREFNVAADLDPAGRRAFLDSLAGQDAGLAREVESLLEYDVRDQPLAPLVLLSSTGTDSTHRSSGNAGGRWEAPEAGTVVAGRYRIGDVVGRGGGGVVCRARDLQTGGDVAIKFLGSGRTRSERGVRRFRREFRAVARLDHPGCLQAFAEGIEGDRRYIVMEYVSGGDLDRLVGAPTDVLLAVLVRVAVALDYVHSRRIVHRDLKPANILLTAGDSPTPRVADFGIALLDDEPSWQTEGGLVGTVDYLSPEQVEGKPADPRSDLYAFGCIIFRLWAGRPPFVGPSYARLSARCHDAPPRLRELAPAAPAGLEDLAARLLAADPRERPQSALEVAGVLAALLVDTASPLASRVLESTSRSVTGAFLYAPGFVGRDAELARLVTRSRAMAAGAPGEPVVFAVCAAAGMGKTTLAHAVLRSLAGEGFRTLVVSVPATSAGPLAPFPELRSLLESADGERLAQREPRRVTEDGGNGFLQEAAAFAERLRKAHAAAPLAVLIEDLHNADRGSASFLVEVARRLAETAGPRPVLIATLRSERRAVLLEAASGAGSGQLVSWVDLEPLDAAGAAAIAAAMMGVRVPQLPPALVPLMLLETDGSPLLLHSALRALIDSGALQRSGGAWVLDEARTKARAVGRALADRLSALSSQARRVLEVAAAVGRRFDAELIASVLRTDDDSVQDGLDEAIRAAVIRPAPAERQRDVFEFDHARLAEVLNESMAPSSRTACHGALAQILAGRGAAPVVLARHHKLGGEPLAAARHLRAAGEEALQQFDHAGAATLFREALAQCDALQGDGTTGPIRDACQEGLADAVVVVGPISEAAALLTAMLLPRSPSLHGSRPRRLRKLGYARMRSGDTAGAVAALEEALATVKDGLPRSRFGLVLRGLRDVVSVTLRRILSLGPVGAKAAPSVEEAAIVHRELGQLYRWIDLERSMAHHLASARAAERVGSPELRVSAYSWLAMSLAFSANVTMSLALDRLAGRLARAAEDRVGLARLALLRAGIDLLVRDDVPLGLAGFDEGVRLAQASGDRMLHAWALAWRGWGCVFACRLDQARVDLERARAVGLELGIGWLVADASSALNMVDIGEGNFDNAVRVARELLASDVRLALPAIEALSTELLGAVAFARGQYREAAAEMSRARDIYNRHHLERGWGHLLEMEETDALLCLADQQGRSAVPDLLQRIRANARSYDRRFQRVPLYQGCVEMLRGILDARAGRHARARLVFSRVLAARAGRRETYVDAWMLWRTAFERRVMGDDVAELLPLVDEADQIFERRGVTAFRQWLAQSRKIYGL